MEDRAVALLQEIRDLLQRTVANQEQILRANDEAIRIYKAAARRQLFAIVATLIFIVILYLLLAVSVTPAGAQVRRLAELNTEQIRSLDRSRTVVLLPGGMLEEHGPYLPAFTDGILSDRLTDEIARGVERQKPGWTALVFPQAALGASGYNEAGFHYVYPGTYTVRPNTLRAVFMDLADELGLQGFRWIVVVHVHGAPLHIRALDQAGDYFRDTYGGRMINLWGLLPVLAGWGNVLQTLPADQKLEEGVSLHAGMDETSLMLYLRPELVAPGYRTAPVVTGKTTQESFAVARRPDWPGYLGSPRLGTAALGEQIWKSFAAAATKVTLDVLDGTDPAQYTRYADLLGRNALFRPWIDSTAARDSVREAAHRAWLNTRPRP